MDVIEWGSGDVVVLGVGQVEVGYAYSGAVFVVVDRCNDGGVQ